MKEASRPPEGGLMARMNAPADRRQFLRATSVAAAAGLLVVACDDDDDITPPGNGGDGVTIDVSTDIGILNFAYALEQLEAAYYAQAVDTPYSGITQAELSVLTSLRNHEVVHRQFLEAALGKSAIGALTPNFEAVDFSSRASVLGTARVFEDLGVAAYNGAGPALTSADFLLVAGKIVSVEARHASAIRDLLQPTSAFSVGEGTGDADVVDDQGLDRALSFQEVLSAAAPFIETEITLQGA